MSSFGLRLAAITIASTCACAWAAPAGAQLLEHKDLTASIGITIAQTAIETCKANGYAVSATVVGRNGEIIVQVRGDNTAPHTMENSFRKAYTSRTLRSPSSEGRSDTRLYPSDQHHRLPGRATDQGGRRSHRRGRCVGRTGRRERRSLRQGRARQGGRSDKITPHARAKRKPSSRPK